MHKPDSRSLLLRAAVALQLIPALAVADDGGAGAEGAGLEVITVTAQKVSEDLQKTAAAVTAISGDVLVSAGVYDIRGVQNLMPSVRFQAENASTELYIRGVGSTLDLPNIEPPNAFNFNGVYIPREGTSVGLFDISSIELLPGPAGHAVRTRGARWRRQRRVQPADAGARDERRARGGRLFAPARHDRAEPAGVGATRAARGVRLHPARRLPEDRRGLEGGLRGPALGALHAHGRPRHLRLAARREERRQVAQPRASRLQRRYVRWRPERVQHERPVGRPHRSGCADGVAAGLREHGARRAGRLGPGRRQAHVHPRLLLSRLGGGLLAREHSGAAHRALQPGHQRVAARERHGLEAAVARRPVCVPGDERRRLHRRRLSARAGVAQPARRLCGLWRGDVFVHRCRALHGWCPLQLGQARGRGSDSVRRAVLGR